MEDIEVTVQSILPSDEPQGRFRLRISPDSTVENLLKELCREANAPLRPEYSLRSKGNDLLQRTETLARSGVQDGAFLHWTSEGVEVKTSCTCNTFWYLATVSFIIGVVGIIVIFMLRFKNNDPIIDYAVVFDAGSTHTAMFIYKWEGSKLNGTAVAVQHGSRCKTNGSGIADFASDPEAAGASLQGCLQVAKKSIPSSKHSETPVYLGATAGMRLLNETNSTASDAIMTSVRQTFSNSSFKFTNATQSARIISGFDEGTFSWITTNYATNAFKVRRPGVKGLIAPTIVPSIGALDLGGASTQITFVPENGTGMPAEYTQVLKLFGHNYTIYTHSYLCYGVNEMENRVLAALVKEQGTNATTVEHACLPKGYNLTRTHKMLYNSPCVSGKAGLTAFGFNLLQEDDIFDDQQYTFVGGSNAGECEKLVNRSIFNMSSCPYKSCSFNGVYQPPITGPFYAFSAFYYVSHFLNLTKTSSSYKHEDLVEGIQDICRKNWTELLEVPASRVEKQSLMWYCQQSIYINLLLYNGYNFSQDWQGINFVQLVSNLEVGWTLGFVLNQSNGYPVDTSEPALYTVTFVLLAILFCLFLIASALLAIQGKRVTGSRTVRYRRLSTYGAI